MSKREEIESALLRLDGGRFQQLGDAYLRKLGYQGVNWLGRSLGSDKVARGTPDTWISQPNGKFIFAEYTTISRAELSKKLHTDLNKCLDERLTGVSVSQIQEILLIHNSVLSPADERSLLERGEECAVQVTTIGIGPLTLDLNEKYPILALDYLSVEVDTGQMLTQEDFVERYGMNELATPLDTAFYGREEEVTDVIKRLEFHNLLVVTGRPGVGKTRFVLECFQRFMAAHGGWTIRCILNRNRDIFNDLRAHLTPPGKYLVLVDDANRVSGFDYVLERLHDRKSGIELKVVATVRDYAREKVRIAVRPYGGGGEVELHSLSEDEIRHILETEYGIRNSRFLDRITDIANGNARLAVMAARVVVAEKTLASIQDVTSLYDRYYASVRDELGGPFGDGVLLRVAGIISVLRVVDKCHSEQMERISRSFGITTEAFWEAAQRLHEMELLDMYENEVVRISDQVLATYLFYLAAFVQHETLDLRELIADFFPEQRYRLMDAIHGVLNAFDVEAISSKLRPYVKEAVRVAEEAGDENKLLHLTDAFWFTSPTDTLVTIQHRLASMHAEEREEPLNLDPQKAKGSIQAGTLLHALGHFRYAGEWRRVALDLLLELAAKKPSDLPHVVRYLIERYGFRHTSQLEGYEVELDVVDALVDRMQRDTDPLIIRIFCKVAEAFLRTCFHTSDWRDDGLLRRYDFRLTGGVDVSILRTKIWTQLIALARGEYRRLALGVLHSHAVRWQDVTIPEVAADATLVLPFIETELNPNLFKDCVVANAYLDLLDHRDVPYPEALRLQFRSDEYVISELLDPGWGKRLEVGFEDYSAWWNSQVAQHFAHAATEDYMRFFTQAETIVAAAEEEKKLNLRFAVEGVLAELSTRKPDLFVSVINEYLAAGNPLAFGRQRLPAGLIGHVGPDRALEILTAHEYYGRRLWLFDYFQVLPQEEITSDHLDQLLTLFGEAQPGECPYDWQFLKRYLSVDPQVFIRVAEILVDRAVALPAVGRAFEALFRSQEVVGELPTLFRGREELIEKAYLLMQFDQPHSDYNGAAFDLLLTLNPKFGLAYIDWVFEHHIQSKPYRSPAPDPDLDHRRYDLIWRRGDYQSIMEEIVQRVYLHETSYFGLHSYTSIFFAVYADDKEDQRSRALVVRNRQEEVLANLIERRASDIDFIEWVFELISGFSAERRVRLLAKFLACNQNVDDFKRLTLDQKHWSASGSFVPVYQKRIEVLQSFLPLVKASAFLPHRKRIEDEIAEYRAWIDAEKRRNFMGH